MFHGVAKYLRQAGWNDYHVLQLKADLSIRDSDDMLWWIFRDRDNTPAALGKFSSSPETRESARREIRILNFLAPWSADLGTPSILFAEDGDNYVVHVQAFLPGNRLESGLSPADGGVLASQLDLVEPWLHRLQSRVPAKSDCGREFRELLNSNSDLFSPALIAAAPDAAAKLDGVAAVAVHGDFWAHNILVSGTRVSVVDWSTFHYGAPLEDLFTFAAAALFSHDRPVSVSADINWRLFFGSSPAAAAARSACARLLARHNLTNHLLQPLFLMFLARRLASTQFLDNPAWREFSDRYIGEGAPAPWGHLFPAPERRP